MIRYPPAIVSTRPKRNMPMPPLVPPGENLYDSCLCSPSADRSSITARIYMRQRDSASPFWARACERSKRHSVWHGAGAATEGRPYKELCRDGHSALASCCDCRNRQSWEGLLTGSTMISMVVLVQGLFLSHILAAFRLSVPLCARAVIHARIGIDPHLGVGIALAAGRACSCACIPIPIAPGSRRVLVTRLCRVL